MNQAALESERPGSESAIARRIATCAIRSLHAELRLYPKPGLVSLHDSGAHADMNAGTFLRSMFALRRYFHDIAKAGYRGVAFSELRRLGMAAETRMLRATGDVNTHRGAIFALGLLAAAAGRSLARSNQLSDPALVNAVLAWRRGLLAHRLDTHVAASHGRWVAARYGVKGARGEAIDAFPGVFAVGLPALRYAVEQGAGITEAQVHTFFTLLAKTEDTNVLYRGGVSALDWIRSEAAAFLACGSVFADGWLVRARAIHIRCCELELSPGGCADLFSGCWFVHQLQLHV